MLLKLSIDGDVFDIFKFATYFRPVLGTQHPPFLCVYIGMYVHVCTCTRGQSPAAQRFIERGVVEERADEW